MRSECTDTRTHTRERARDYFDVLTINAGYYPAGVQGVGGSAVVFVLSTDYWFGGTWYMLNQVPLLPRTIYFTEHSNSSTNTRASDHTRPRPKCAIPCIPVRFFLQRQLLGIRKRFVTVLTTRIHGHAANYTRACHHRHTRALVIAAFLCLLCRAMPLVDAVQS